MLKIRLNSDEYNYINKEKFLDQKYLKLFSLPEKEDNNYILIFSEDQADELRDLFGEQLQKTGFDEKYELTKTGKILESLIDKFYIG